MPAKMSEGRRSAHTHSLVAQSARLAGGAAGHAKVGLLDRNNMRGRMLCTVPDMGAWSRILHAGDFRGYHSRASVGWYVGDDGKLRQAAANVIRVGQAPSGAPDHFISEPAATNKCSNYNANPNEAVGTTATTAGSSITGITLLGDAAAVLTIVDDTAALTAAGFDEVCTSLKAYKLDNSAGVANTTAVITGATGNTSQHTTSAYLRGSGQARVGQNNLSGSANTITAAYARYSATLTPTGTTSTAGVTAAAGAIVYFILNQMEQSAFITQPIVTAGSQVTRALDAVTISDDYRAFVGEREGSLYAALEVPAGIGGSSSIVAINKDASNRGPQLNFGSTNAANMAAVWRDSTLGTFDLDAGAASTAATPLRTVSVWRHNQGYQAAVAAVGSTVGTLARNTNKSPLFDGSALRFVVSIGGIQPMYIKEVRFGKRALSENEMLQLMRL